VTRSASRAAGGPRCGPPLSSLSSLSSLIEHLQVSARGTGDCWGCGPVAGARPKPVMGAGEAKTVTKQGCFSTQAALDTFVRAMVARYPSTPALLLTSLHGVGFAVAFAPTSSCSLCLSSPLSHTHAPQPAQSSLAHPHSLSHSLTHLTSPHHTSLTSPLSPRWRMRRCG
jgi:hypothetical protein